MKKYLPSSSFLRVATATPPSHLANVRLNIAEHKLLFEAACKNQVSLVVFPELSITSYSIGDLAHSQSLIEEARMSLSDLASMTIDENTAMIVGLPLMVGNALYNCAVFISKGEILGVTPKRNLPNYKEFYEKRWYQSWNEKDTNIELNGRLVPFGQPVYQIGKAIIGIEICEDLWVADQPSIALSKRGATIICNPSASPETVTKAIYRRDLVNLTAARLIAGYIYAGADPSESTMDVVLGGHAIISECGRLIAERKPFAENADRLTVGEIDIDHLLADRRKDTNFNQEIYLPIKTYLEPLQKDLLSPPAKYPFIPNTDDSLHEIFSIQTFGLKKRLEASGVKKILIGLSGGLDSTLALLVAIRTAKLMKIKPSDLILTLTMPSQASSKRTQNNAVQLAKSLNIENIEIPISKLSNAQLLAIDHNGSEQDITYENTQARIRTSLLFNTANQQNGIVLGTGDLSEIALGWCTYNGDHMSGYNVNASIPKTLVRHLVRYAANQLDNIEAKIVLEDILDTPISPELTKNSGSNISQKTEDLIGPYELHDFFLYQFIRWQTPLNKIKYLATTAFSEEYTEDVIDNWLAVFRKRFTSNQWKRSVMTDGPKVGSISLSPRGDWRMPSDANEAEY